jgi:hypothetical protein
VAINASAVWEVRSSTGNDSNGGGWRRGGTGTDRSQQDSAHVVVDGATITATVHTTTTQVTLSGYTVTSADVNNHFQISGGTATAGFYEITAVDTGNNRWTLDRSAGTSTQTANGRMGGALATLQKLVGVIVADNVIYAKGTTFSMTGNAFNLTTTSLIGYSSTRHDSGMIVIDCSGMTAGQDAITCSTRTYRNIRLNSPKNNGFQWGDANPNFINCVVSAAGAAGYSAQFNQGNAFNCVADSCTGDGFKMAYVWGCISGRNGGDGFTVRGNSGFASATGCIAFGNTGNGFDGDSVDYSNVFVNCLSYGNTQSGFLSAYRTMAINCVAWGNATYGFRNSFQSVPSVLFNCAAGSNTSGNFSNVPGNNGASIGEITLTADPTVDGGNATVGSKDFSLNTTSGGGASLRSAGYSQTFTDIVTSALPAGYPDIGPWRHQDPAGGGGGAGPLISGRLVRA